MSEMIERVALAIFKSNFHPDDAANEALIAEKRAEWPGDWCRAERQARTAIEAMREPTEAMAAAGEEKVEWDSDDRSGGWFPRYRDGDASMIFSAMIDEALK